MVDYYELGYLYTSKSKIYPDGTMITTYANKPKFSMIPQKRKKKFKPDKKIMEWSYETMFKTNITYNNGYIYIDPETGEQLYIGPFLDTASLVLTSINPLKSSQKTRSDVIKRTRDKIYDLVALNEWSYFFTGTLGDTFFDSTNAKSALMPLQNWLKHMSNRKGLKYVLVAELQPKSGRIHFHGFINDVLEMVDSGTRLVPWYHKPVKLETIRRKGHDPEEYADRVVYNCPQWKFGFTTAIKAYNGSQACARYIMKYITKENKAVFGRYYWSSRNLEREPHLYFEDFDYNKVYMPEYSIPRTTDAYKYYTFFPGETKFFWEQEEQPQSRSDFETAAANSAAIFDILADFEEVDTFSDFEEIEVK